MGSTYQSITVNAPADAVWQRLRRFHDFGWAADVIDRCDAIGHKAEDQIGAQRLLNGAFEETLIAMDEEMRTLSYTIDDGPSPVSSSEVRHYIGMIRVPPITEEGRSFVEWSSRWEAQTDDAVDFCHNIYVALLGALRRHFG